MSKYFLHFLCFNLKHGLLFLRFPLEKKTKQNKNRTKQTKYQNKQTNKAKQKHKMKKRKL